MLLTMRDATLPPPALPDTTTVGPRAATATAPPVPRPRWHEPVLVATLVLPSLATNPALWLAVAGDAVGGPQLAAVVAVAGGVAFGGVAAVAAGRWSRARGASARTARAHVAECLALCVIGALLAALSPLVLGGEHVRWIAAGLAISTLVFGAGVARRSEATVVIGLVALNVIWSIDLALLALAGVDALLTPTAV